MSGPVTVVPYYEPIWEENELPPRLANYRALIDPKDGTLIQQRVRYAGEKQRVQIGKKVSYFYQGADGTYAASLAGGIYPGRLFPRLDETFDPANPPDGFAELQIVATFYPLSRAHLFRSLQTIRWAEVVVESATFAQLRMF